MHAQVFFFLDNFRNGEWSYIYIYCVSLFLLAKSGQHGLSSVRFLYWVDRCSSEPLPGLCVNSLCIP